MKRVSSKIRKTKVLLRNKQLASYIPLTKRFSRDTLKKMLRRYDMVYLKPVHGLKGIGIMRVKKKGSKYQLRKGASAVLFKTKQDLYKYIRSKIHMKPYVVQKGIRMLRYRNRPFDFRIMVQKNRENAWIVSGIVGRVALPMRIVTNRSQGGQCMPAKRLLRSTLSHSKTNSCLVSIFRLSRRVGRQFQRAYPKAWELGVDIAVSRDLKPWILEVNTNPAITPFIRLGNRRMYKTINHLRRLNRKRYS